MHLNRILTSLVWSLIFTVIYIISKFGFLKSFLTGGFSYYIAILISFVFLIYLHYTQEDKLFRIRSLFKIFFQFYFIFIATLISLSVLFPESFVSSELTDYEGRFLANGYSAAEIADFIDIIRKLYYISLIVGSFLTHFIIFFILIIFILMYYTLKSKFVNKRKTVSS